MSKQSNPRRAGGCIYCGSLGPFSDEHVVSAGLGGDDKQWMLRGCVCENCNTRIFSKLEAKVLYSSPVAIARLFSQPFTRNKGTPSVQPKTSFFAEPNSKILLEVELGPQGQTDVLPQVILSEDGAASIYGANAGVLSDFIDALQRGLADNTVLIEKTTSEFEVHYPITPIAWTNDAYAVGDTTPMLRPPKGGFWIETIHQPPTAQGNKPVLPRVFRRPGGQIVCRAISPRQAAGLLTIVRKSPDLFAAKGRLGGAEQVEQEQPGVHQGYNVDLSAYDRVLTKIGLNLVAHLLGTDFVRDAAFDAAAEYAREGKGNILKHPAARASKNATMLGKALLNRHVLMLTRGPAANGGHTVIFTCRLYGGPLEMIRLADMKRDIPELERPLLIHVDYAQQLIVQKTLEEHTADIAGLP